MTLGTKTDDELAVFVRLSVVPVPGGVVAQIEPFVNVAVLLFSFCSARWFSGSTMATLMKLLGHSVAVLTTIVSTGRVPNGVVLPPAFRMPGWPPTTKPVLLQSTICWLVTAPGGFGTATTSPEGNRPVVQDHPVPAKLTNCSPSGMMSRTSGMMVSTRVSTAPMLLTVML